MKINKKGFTLVELLAVLILITVITLIAYPSYSSLIETANSKYDNTVKVLTINAAKMYVNNYNSYVEDKLKNDNTYCIPIGKLVAYEYLDSDLEDSDGNQISYDTCVNVSKDTSGYNYEMTNDTTTESDYLPPTLAVKNKESNTLVECKTIMTVSSIDEFDSLCEIVVVDNADDEDSILLEYETKETDTGILLKYTATDSNNNESLPLKIKLIISSN